CQQGFKTPYTF
nr:immunoglobulin light chain junction region [Macaca mulatta]